METSVGNGLTFYRGEVCERSLHFTLFCTATLSLTVWELYYGGIRPLDFAALALLSFGWTIPDLARSVRLNALGRLSYLLVPVVASVFLGVWNDTENVKAGLGVLLGAIFFVMVGSWPLSQRDVLRIARICLYAHLVFFWVQLLAFRLAGVFVNYLAFAGLEPRAFSPFFRPPGLFMEPATFALFCVMLVGLRYSYERRMSGLDYFVLASACASLSLWGIVASVMLVTWASWRRLWFWCLSLVAGVIVLLNRALLETILSLPVLGRLTSLREDPSATQRYGLSGNALNVDWTFQDWFGVGVNSYHYFAFGLNGWSYILTATGFIGTLAFLFWIFVSTPARSRLFAVFLVSLCLTAGYMWTTFFWWWWLALLTRRYQSPRRAS